MNKVYLLSHVRDEGDKDEDEKKYWILHNSRISLHGSIKIK
ncbi:Uncharacterised protein [Salmonella enterica subsp. salamae]|nr:Uncharacterised protein [Salmonella enterica subsp. salamae]